MQCLTDTKSFRFADMVQEGWIAMFFDGNNGQLINISIHKIDSFTLLILVIIEFYKRKIQVMSKSEATAAFQNFEFVLSFL